MKKQISLVLTTLLMTGCSTSSQTVWEETKSFGEYLTRKSKELFMNDQSESKAIESKDQIAQRDDYIPLLDQDLRPQYAEVVAPQAHPSQERHIEKFKDPSHELAAIFKMVHFNTDDDKIRVKEYQETLKNIAEYLKVHPDIFVFVEGHTDDRASEKHNFALASRRANTVRNFLVKEGVQPDQIYTISYGKERLMAKGTTRSARAKNRRVEFKIFDSSKEGALR
jgi:peptidoglycan-associated lipoprotein